MRARAVFCVATLLTVGLSPASTQLRGRISDGVYTSPSGSFQIAVPYAPGGGMDVIDEAPDSSVWMVSFSDTLCREFIVTERAGPLAGDSLAAWVDREVIPKLRTIGVDLREQRQVSTREGPAIFVRYHHPQGATCMRLGANGKAETMKADADVGVYIYHLRNRFYRLLYVRGERHDLDTTNIRLGPVDTILGRFADGFAVSRRSNHSQAHPKLAALSIGNAFSCGLGTDSIAYCWGAAEYDELMRSYSPTPIAELAFTQLSAENSHSCAIVTAGAAYCWGSNFLGMLGIGSDSVTHSWNPAPVSGGLRFASITVNVYHSCALTATGSAYCWGMNEHGELGTGDTVHRNAPAAVTGGLRFKMLSAGLWFTCGVTTEGAAYCWGNNHDSELGAQTTEGCRMSGVDWPCSTKPIAVAGRLAFNTLDAGSSFACGVTMDGAGYCWGTNAYGVLGSGQKMQKLERSVAPISVAGGLHFTSVGAGSEHACGLTTDGRAYCWGWNRDDRLGVTGKEASAVPVAVSGGLTFTSLSVGDDHTCGIASDGDVYCWGLNFNGSLGSSSLIRNGRIEHLQAQPVKVDPLP